LTKEKEKETALDDDDERAQLLLCGDLFCAQAFDTRRRKKGTFCSFPQKNSQFCAEERNLITDIFNF
jgi:exonuclease III